MRTHVVQARSSSDMVLHVTRQFHTLLHVFVLNKLKHDVAFGRRRVKALILLLVIFLQKDDRVLAFGHLQVLQDAFLSGVLSPSKGISLQSSHPTTTRQGIDVNRDKQVGTILIGDFSASGQRDKDISLTRIDDLDVGTITLNHLPKGQCELQNKIFFL